MTNVFAGVGFGLRMTIGAKNPKILQAVVIGPAVDMIQVQRDRLSQLLRQSANRTTVFKDALFDQACFEC